MFGMVRERLCMRHAGRAGGRPSVLFFLSATCYAAIRAIGQLLGALWLI